MYLSSRSLLGFSGFALAVALCGSAAYAEKADRNQPLRFEADVLRTDNLKKTSHLSGNVVLTKGTILMRAAEVDFREDASGNQAGTILGNPQNRAFFRQKRDGVDEFVEGESERIEYDGRTDSVQFIGKAVLRRLRAGRVMDEMQGAVIVYDSTNDTLRVDGKTTAATGAVPSAAGAAMPTRIRGMISPKPPESPSK